MLEFLAKPFRNAFWLRNHKRGDEALHQRAAELMQTNEELRKNEERIRLAFAAARMVSWDWDIQTDHATIFAEPGDDQPFYVNQQVPERFTDLERYTTPEGLNLIMR